MNGVVKGNVVPIGSKQFHSQWSTTVAAPPSGTAACTSAHHAPTRTQDKLLNAVDALDERMIAEIASSIPDSGAGYPRFTSKLVEEKEKAQHSQSPMDS
jgi:hypothetical protein